MSYVTSRSLMALMTISLLGGPALAQNQPSLKEQLIGKWTLVSFTNVGSDGTRRYLYGENPKGIFIIDADGSYAQVQVNPDRMKFKAKNRLQGTAEENKAALSGSYATFGTWSVDEKSRTFVRNIEASASFPNEEGAQTRWSIVMTGDRMNIEVPAAAAGGRTELVLQRVSR